MNPYPYIKVLIYAPERKFFREKSKNFPRYNGLSDSYKFSINVSFGTKPAMASLFDGFTSVCPRDISSLDIILAVKPVKNGDYRLKTFYYA